MPSGIVRIDWLSAKTTLTGVGSCSYELEKPGIAPRLFQFSVLSSQKRQNLSAASVNIRLQT